MSLCRNCDTTYDDGSHCRWCQFRREELLERLQPDVTVAAWSEVAMRAIHRIEKMPQRRWVIQ